MCGTSQRRFEVLFGNFAESQLKDFKEAIDEEETAEDYGYLSDSDLEDDEDEGITSPENTREPRVINLNKPVFLGFLGGPPCGEHEERTEKGKVVKIPDIAFVT